MGKHRPGEPCTPDVEQKAVSWWELVLCVGQLQVTTEVHR